MGMLLRRHERTADNNPKVNGKPVEKPKNKNLTQKENNNNNETSEIRIPKYRV